MPRKNRFKQPHERMKNSGWNERDDGKTIPATTRLEPGPSGDVVMGRAIKRTLIVVLLVGGVVAISTFVFESVLIAPTPGPVRLQGAIGVGAGRVDSRGAVHRARGGGGDRFCPHQRCLWGQVVAGNDGGRSCFLGL